MTFLYSKGNGQILPITSLHTTGLSGYLEYVQHLYKLAEPSVTEKVEQVFGHNFLRSLDINKRIAREIKVVISKAR